MTTPRRYQLKKYRERQKVSGKSEAGARPAKEFSVFALTGTKSAVFFAAKTLSGGRQAFTLRKIYSALRARNHFMSISSSRSRSGRRTSALPLASQKEIKNQAQKSENQQLPHKYTMDTKSGRPSWASPKTSSAPSRHVFDRPSPNGTNC